jgi:hypothetical protein
MDFDLVLSHRQSCIFKVLFCEIILELSLQKFAAAAELSGGGRGCGSSGRGGCCASRKV